MYYSLTAIILKRQDFKEDDLLVTVYSREKGKISLVARGAKKILSKLAGHLEPVSLVIINAATGRGIDQLIGCEISQSYYRLKNNLKNIELAGWFLKILDDLTLENHKDEQIFNLIHKYLDFLNKEAQDDGVARVAATFKLLYLLGFNPVHKEEQKLRAEINYIIKHTISEIKHSHDIKNKLGELNKLLSQEISEHL